uniref:Uncharacterized protein n=1 Tax=Timema poppense TaxID=170557 RepID=A0A7R9DCX3_TIMPO|nr:unnamed protein product [Timema poppensis]
MRMKCMACDVGRPGNDAHMYIDWETYAVMGIKAMKSFSRPRGSKYLRSKSVQHSGSRQGDIAIARSFANRREVEWLASLKQFTSCVRDRANLFVQTIL